MKIAGWVSVEGGMAPAHRVELDIDLSEELATIARMLPDDINDTLGRIASALLDVAVEIGGLK